ncbi:uncharacterized protein LOC133833833 isoform X1 [Humulus lupulus]|uniref:uncharacterized protein LOC133833833 isoform X1 n=1 Tax=Humulus lupulus TaxID=3486 RepID=UPI002B406128|nr:uncharacterized protein LOC133833833 isoform X1 [Humulus lupulus]
MDLDSVSNYDEVRSSIFEKAELFDKFLNGSTLVECYSAVASVANRWLDLLDVCLPIDFASYAILLSSVIFADNFFFIPFPTESRKGYCGQ